MDHPMAMVGLILAIFALFLAGAVVQDITRDTRCKSGTPQVVDGKVYRCVEQK